MHPFPSKNSFRAPQAVATHIGHTITVINSFDLESNMLNKHLKSTIGSEKLLYTNVFKFGVKVGT